MGEDTRLPLEILREKYIPVEDFPSKYGVSVNTCMRLLKEKKVRRGEFNKPGESRRSLHLNYEEVLSALEGEKS